MIIKISLCFEKLNYSKLSCHKLCTVNILYLSLCFPYLYNSFVAQSNCACGNTVLIIQKSIFLSLIWNKMIKGLKESHKNALFTLILCLFRQLGKSKMGTTIEEYFLFSWRMCVWINKGQFNFLLKFGWKLKGLA